MSSNLPIEITVGGPGPYDPVAGTSICIIPALKGRAIWIDKATVGPLASNLYTIPAGGGFALAAGTFQNGDFYRVYSASNLLVAEPNDYTNGFNTSQVVNAILGRLGFRRSTLPAQPVLNTVNSTSRSGRWYNEAHALVTIPIIKAILDNPAMTDDEFNDELIAIQIGVIMQFLNGVFSEKEIIEQVLLYDRFGYLDRPIENTGSFAGYELNLAPVFDKATQIESAVLLFDRDVTFTLYLFKDGRKTPIWSQSVTAVANEATVVDLDNLVLNYIAPTTKGGRFFLGYFQEDIGEARAISEQSYQWAQTYLFSARPFYAPKTPGQVEFITANRYYPYTAMGINLQVSTFSDWTAAIVKKAALFDELNSLTMAFTVVEKIVYTTNQSGIERILKNGLAMPSAIQDLNGAAPVSDGPPPIVGLNKRITRETDRVKKEFFPKPQAQSVTIC